MILILQIWIPCCEEGEREAGGGGREGRGGGRVEKVMVGRWWRRRRRGEDGEDKWKTFIFKSYFKSWCSVISN